jgi:hypothetical protein
VDDHDRLVGIYLRDHLAGSVAALELVERAARSNETNELGEFLRSLHEEIRADQDTLLDVMKTLGVEPSRVKNGLAWTVEKAGRLKLNGRLLRYSPLSRLHELETLEAGIVGKRSLWTNLQSLDDPRLAGLDLPRLVERAEAQRAGVEQWRRRAAAALRIQSTPQSLGRPPGRVG